MRKTCANLPTPSPRNLGVTTGPGAKVWDWLKQTASKIPGTAGDVGVAATKAVVTAAVLKFFGMS